MGFIIAVLVVFIIARERYYRQKLWLHETFVEQMPFDSIMFDNKGRYRIISSGAIKDPKVRRWLVGKTDIDYWTYRRKDPEPGKKRLEMIKKAVETKETQSIEEDLLDREGNERVHLRMVRPIFDSKGKHLATLGFSYELTAIKQKERELNEINKVLKRSNEDLDNFAHVASHDLRTPLRSITSFLQLFVRKNQARFDDTDREYVKFISHGAKQMDSLIQSLLGYATIDRHKVLPKTVHLNKTLDSVQLGMASLINDRHVYIEVSPLPTLVVHDFLMIQLFQNLIGNGIKYNKNVSPRIEVFVVNNNESTITYAVRDNGIGISEQYKDTVFKIFQRLHRIEEYEGSGIGLAACKRIVDLYGGKIWFESSEKGTTFFLTLPACPVVEKTENILRGRPVTKVVA
jgi:signal transduction histidine kinase